MRTHRSTYEKKPKKFILIIIAAVVIIAIIAIYIGCTDDEEVQTTGIQTVDIERGHFDLLFSEYGEVSFNYVGRQVSVYVAHFEYYELVLHELVARTEYANVEEFSGNMIWGITKNGNALDELRVRISTLDESGGGVAHQGYFDFSPLDFEIGAVINPTILREPLERGERYVFHVRQTGTVWWLDDDWFDPEVLAENAQTVILYIVLD